MSQPQGTADPTYPPGADRAVSAEGLDVSLVRRIAAGDRAVLAELYGLHGQVLLAQINLVVGEQTLSEEILQDTMLAVWRGAGSFRGDSRVRSWLIAIARRQARDRLRRHRFRVVDETVLAEVPASRPRLCRRAAPWRARSWHRAAGSPASLIWAAKRAPSPRQNW